MNTMIPGAAIDRRIADSSAIHLNDAPTTAAADGAERPAGSPLPRKRASYSCGCRCIWDCSRLGLPHQCKAPGLTRSTSTAHLPAPLAKRRRTSEKWRRRCAPSSSTVAESELTTSANGTGIFEQRGRGLNDPQLAKNCVFTPTKLVRLSMGGTRRYCPWLSDSTPKSCRRKRRPKSRRCWRNDQGRKTVARSRPCPPPFLKPNHRSPLARSARICV